MIDRVWNFRLIGESIEVAPFCVKGRFWNAISNTDRFLPLLVCRVKGMRG